ncbi:box C/D snoRNA protein 1-like [Saccoglossus kowalevskii]|uniref:Box C/D snoRNA protein 1-like n=1 Tax=Saccoglossus kowalevskii TaxID=10224 RepID=A0ABM0MH53_SACKO|nr:PREDICTED: box C/D snoRNA protein 1-like [Saccoglossus kowalevskii]
MTTEKRCEVCNEHIAKYRCPRCTLRTCSLPCVKTHKQNNDCDGIRNKVSYVTVKNFTESHLISDYRFLEDVDRKIDNVAREMRHKHRFIPRYLMNLIRAAKSRKTTLKILPFVFTKRKENSTIWLSRQKQLLWHVELIFPHCDVKYSERRVSEKICLRTLLEKYLHPVNSDPVIRHRLKQYVLRGFDEIRIVMKVERRMAKSTRYMLLDLDRSLEENLASKYIVEYPSLYVILADHIKDYPILGEVKTDCSSSSSDTDSSSDSESNTSGSMHDVAPDRGRVNSNGDSPSNDSKDLKGKHNKQECERKGIKQNDADDFSDILCGNISVTSMEAVNKVTTVNLMDDVNLLTKGNEGQDHYDRPRESCTELESTRDEKVEMDLNYDCDVK